MVKLKVISVGKKNNNSKQLVRINHLVPGFRIWWSHFSKMTMFSCDSRTRPPSLLSGFPAVVEQKVNKGNLIVEMRQQKPLAGAQQPFPLLQKRTALNPRHTFQVSRGRTSPGPRGKRLGTHGSCSTRVQLWAPPCAWTGWGSFQLCPGLFCVLEDYHLSFLSGSSSKRRLNQRDWSKITINSGLFCAGKQTKKIPFLSLNSCMLDGAVTNRFQSLTCLFGAIAVINEKPQKSRYLEHWRKEKRANLKCMQWKFITLISSSIISRQPKVKNPVHQSTLAPPPLSLSVPFSC